MAITYISGPEFARREAGAALDEALDVLFAALPRVEALAREEERAAERAAVVAALRRFEPGPMGLSLVDMASVAASIERGEHRREGGE
jgi:hypothetical protein